MLLLPPSYVGRGVLTITQGHDMSSLPGAGLYVTVRGRQGGWGGDGGGGGSVPIFLILSPPAASV